MSIGRILAIFAALLALLALVGVGGAFPLIPAAVLVLAIGVVVG